jgi:hypothetical protein
VLLDSVPCTVTTSDLSSITCIPGAKPTGTAPGPVYRPGPSGLVVQTWRNVSAFAGNLQSFATEPRYPGSPNSTLVSEGARACMCTRSLAHM